MTRVVQYGKNHKFAVYCHEYAADYHSVWVLCGVKVVCVCGAWCVCVVRGVCVWCMVCVWCEVSCVAWYFFKI